MEIYFSVDFELLGEIKPHDLKPGGSENSRDGGQQNGVLNSCL